MTDAATPTVDRRKAIEDLEAQLSRIPRSSRPYEHAAVAYRLGLAYAEASLGNPAEGFRRALACYDVAAAIFDPRFDPAEHARVLNAAGAAHRGLGDPRRAAGLFEKAATLLEGRGRDPERAAALNNLGLTLAELGEHERAVSACDAALPLFDEDTAEGRRGRAATLHNRGMARAAIGTRGALEGALSDYREAADQIDVGEAPYHFALVHHSIGATCSALAGVVAADDGATGASKRLVHEAVSAFTQSLAVFRRTDFPQQHAVAKHNLGLALVALGEPDDLRRALACFEDAAAVFDPRQQGAAWQQAYANLQRVEDRLGQQYPGTSRSQHFATLISNVDEREAIMLLRDRLTRLLDLREEIAHGVFIDLALAIYSLDFEAARTATTRMLGVLMELPNEKLALVLGAFLDAHERLSAEAEEGARGVLDQAVSDALVGPQRIWVRDYLYSRGFERP
ncbi:MAG: tetratricopeptide repeat protein [Actinobacteria bacterium]|nr:tetratricopeptide repeat protein [Actinomycetota bacterium]